MIKIKIGNYLHISIITSLLFILGVGWFFYLQQRDNIADYIAQEIRASLVESSYDLLTKLDSEKNIHLFSASLQRATDNSNLIKGFLITNKNKVIYTTNAKYNKLPDVQHTCKVLQHIDVNILSKNIYYEQKFFYFENGEKKELYLYLILNQQAVIVLLNQAMYNFFVYFGIITLGLLLAGWFMHKRYIITPLERLRQFAYNQSNPPEPFIIRELECIRTSMHQTFDRLENERQELYDLSRTDQLSGLSNRNALQERLDWLIADSIRDGREFAFLFIDLDHFKSVNDSLGHDIGDELLKNVANYLQGLIRAGDISARIGGDEFVLVFSKYDSVLELTHIINRILIYLKEPFKIRTHTIHLSASIGIALFPKDGHDITTLLKHADIAMYEAKRCGRDQYHFFTESLNESVQETIRMENDLRSALKEQEFKLFYQPKVDLSTGDIIGAEALLRWEHPAKGLVFPDSFIPLCERNGMIVPIGEWVIKEATKQQVAWKNAGIGDIVISVNIATMQLLDEHFETKFFNNVKASGIAHDKLDIEITEYIFLDNSEKNLAILQNLHTKGFTISLDDFGTGYSSLSYLKRFPIDVIKIDKSFLDDFHSKSGAVFIDTIVKMGHTLGVSIIAEGVEEEAQTEYLKSILCDQAQGFYYSKPVKADAFAELLKNDAKRKRLSNMNLRTLEETLLSKQGALKAFPFGEQAMVFKVMNKIFALVTWQETPMRVTLKSSPEDAIRYRELYACVKEGYYMNKKHWNTIILDGTMKDDILIKMIDESYDLVVSKLTKKEKEALHLEDPVHIKSLMVPLGSSRSSP